MIEQLFFELIQVAIGTRICLSHTPSADEWGELYAMAKKQSLVGVCFAGVQRLQSQQQEPPEMLYLRWMGMAAKIQQRNEVVNKQCVELQHRLAADGFQTSILKGQGIAQAYPEHLRGLRQSGDIDIWASGGMKKVYLYALTFDRRLDFDYINAVTPFFSDTIVELHWRVRSVSNLLKNRRLQWWLSKNENDICGKETHIASANAVITTPSDRFNKINLFLHLYTHMFGEGLGLRQVMDFYVFLKSSKSTESEKEQWLSLVKTFSSVKFASAVMWVMGFLFEHDGKDADWMLCKPSETEGLLILRELLEGGNFGKYSNKTLYVCQNVKIMSLQRRVCHTIRLASHYPSEFLNAPLWLVGHYFWKRITKLKVRYQWKKRN